MTRKRCLCCGRWYRPDRRAARVQKSCGRPACRAERRRRKQRDWLKRHPGYGRSRRLKIRGWAAAYPYYWRAYRKRRPDYVERDNRRRGRAHERARRAAKQTGRRRILVEKLLVVKAMAPDCAAKQTESPRRLEALLDALIWSAAPQNKSVWPGSPLFGDDGSHERRDMGRGPQA